MTVAISDPAISLSTSHAYCRDLTRSAARNFYYGLKLLPEPKRSAMFVLYAYMRLVDDIADREDGRSITQRIAELDDWRIKTTQAQAGHVPEDEHAIWPAFTELATHYRVPAKVFDAVIAGQQQDLEPAPFETFAQLREYCYRVAGVVGLASIHIWGYDGDEETEEMAVALGVAFQITNILRDLREDFSRGRVYLPQEDLAAFGIDHPNLIAGGEAFRRLMRFQIERAEAYYAQAAGLVQRVSPDSRATLTAMTEIYHRLLRKVSRDPETVLHKRVSLSAWSKLKIGWRATWTNRIAMSRVGAT